MLPRFVQYIYYIFGLHILDYLVFVGAANCHKIQLKYSHTSAGHNSASFEIQREQISSEVAYSFVKGPCALLLSRHKCHFALSGNLWPICYHMAAIVRSFLWLLCVSMMCYVVVVCFPDSLASLQLYFSGPSGMVLWKTGILWYAISNVFYLKFLFEV